MKLWEMAKYDHGKPTLDRIFSFTKTEGADVEQGDAVGTKDGIAMTFPSSYDNNLQYVEWLAKWRDEESGEISISVGLVGEEDPETVEPEYFLEHVKVYEMRRIA